MKKLNLLIAIFSFGASTIIAQPTIMWEQSFGGTYGDVASIVHETSDGGYITIGYSSSLDGDVTSIHGENDYWVTKHNETGDLVWQKVLGGTAQDFGTSIQETSDGGFILIGYSQSNDGDVSGNHGGNDAWVVKLTSTGVISWQKSLGGSGVEIGSAIKQTADGGYIVAARSTSEDGDVTENKGNTDAWLIKLTSTGDITWQKTYGGSGDDGLTCVELTSDGGYLFGGYTTSADGDVTGHHGDYDYWVIKTNSTGDLLWQKTYGGTGEEACYAMGLTPDGSAILNGSSSSTDGDVEGNHGGNDFWVVKIDDEGTLLWANSLGGTSDDDGRSIERTSDGGYISSGRSQSHDGDVSSSYGSQDYWIVKLGSSGNLEWDLSLGGTQQDYANCIEQTEDDGFIIIGASFSGDEDVSEQIGGGDYWLVKLSAFVGLYENEFVNNFSLYPNPATNDFTINSNGFESLSTYEIIDISGNIVQRGIITSPKTLVNIENLCPGMYSVLISNETGINVSKLIKN